MAMLHLIAALTLFTGGAKKLVPFPLTLSVKAGFPGKPTHDAVALGSVKTDRFSIGYGGVSYRVAIDPQSTSLSKAITADPGGKPVQKSLDVYGAAAAKGLKGKITESSFGAFKGFPAKRWRVEAGNRTYFGVRILTPKRSIGALVGFPKDAVLLGQAQRFFDSVIIGRM